VGGDEEGNKLIEKLDNICAETYGILQLPHRPTTTKVRMMGSVQSAGRGTQQLLRVDHEDSRDMDNDDENVLIRLFKAESIVRNIDIILISDMGKGVCTDRVLREVIDFGKKHNIPVIVDPRLSAGYRRYYGATAITPNRFEAKLATGIEVDNVERMKHAGSILLDMCNLKHVIITVDKDGMFLYNSDGSHKLISTVPKDVYDVSGAGDMVLSIFGLVIGAGRGFEIASKIANIAAGIEVSSIGSVPVSRQQIIQEASRSSLKVKTREELDFHLNKHRNVGDKIVFTNGCFDILHVGHVKYLKFAKAQGQVLVVGVNTNKSVKENKGDKRPFVSEQQRAEVISALECVDYVVMFDDPTPLDIIKEISPDVLVKGEDWAGDVVGSEYVESYNGLVILAPIEIYTSTTDIVNTILEKG
jgi:D-beta-D-heptose 7-phosphate kinase/D-beta-D-heptose 1-phosphate adenosyltransferase